MNKMTPSYPPLTEKDIDLMLKHLQRKNPKATKKMAVTILKRLQKTIREMNLEDPEGLIKLYNKLKLEKKLKTN